MRTTKTGKVFLVGAGPGDPGLLTLRAAAVLRDCDVLLYDALASPETVALASPLGEKIFVGKRGGSHAMPQSEIESLLVRHAKAGRRVVRLKGGDPFVFGRGGEEAQELARAGVPFEIVPGLTSAIAAPAYAGIPVTHRDCNPAFTVVTGHEYPSKPESTVDWARLAGLHHTLVLLMAMGNLADIARRLQTHGLPADRAVAVIRNGTRPSQQTLISTLANVARDVERAGLEAPAVVVIGEVVALREQIQWFERAPLFGTRVLVTRPQSDDDDFASALWALGAQPVVAPTIRIERPPELREASRAAARDVAAFDWLAFGSSTGVDAFFETLRELNLDARHLGAVRVAAMGTKTATALERRGIVADLIPGTFVAEALAQALVRESEPGARVMFFGARETRDVLAAALVESGRSVETVAAYATASCDVDGFEGIVADCDVVTFASASAVRGFARNFGGNAAAAQATRGKTVVCIGPVTAACARETGMIVAAEAREYTAEGLIQAIVACR